VRSAEGQNTGKAYSLLLLMTILAKSLFALVGCHFMALAFFTAWHNLIF
jgi:hypothetical protein